MAEEGWFSGGFKFGDVWETQRGLWQYLQGSMGLALLLVCLLFAASSVGIANVFFAAEQRYEPVTKVVRETWILGPPIVALVLGQYLFLGLTGTFRDRVFNDPPPHSLTAVLGDAGQRIPGAIGATLLVLSAQAVAFVVPGVVPLLLAPLWYVSVTARDMGWRARLSTTWSWTKRHLLTIAGVSVTLGVVCAGLAAAATLLSGVLANIDVSYEAQWLVNRVVLVVPILTITTLTAITFTGLSALFFVIDAEENDLESKLQEARGGADQSYDELMDGFEDTDS